MTGYGTAEVHTEKYSVKVEIKALNGKYLFYKQTITKVIQLLGNHL